MSETTKLPVQFRRSTKKVHHGRTVAAWTGVTIALIGFVMISVGIVMASTLIVGISLGVLALSVVAAAILRAVGLGAD